MYYMWMYTFPPADLEGICSKAQNQEGKRRGNDVYWNGKDKVCDCYFCTYVPEQPEQAFIHFNTVSVYIPSGKENKGEWNWIDVIPPG